MARLKTIVLVILVVISLLLTAILTFSRDAPGGYERDDDWFGAPPAFNDVNKPSRIYIVGDVNAHMVKTFSETYNKLIDTMSQMEYQGGDPWTTGSYQAEKMPPGVLFNYDFSVPREFIASWFNGFYQTDFPFISINKIFVPKDNGPIRFIDSYSQQVWLLDDQQMGEAVAQVPTDSSDLFSFAMEQMPPGGNYNVNPGVFQLVGSREIVVPGWYREVLNHDSLIRSFYLEPNSIQESDGTVTYTDGTQALRIYPTGSLEYTTARARVDQVWENREIVQQGLAFTASHGGWPGDLLPVLGQGQEYLEFIPYDMGMPVVGKEIGLKLNLEGGAIGRYQRNLVRASVVDGRDYAQALPLSQLLVSDTQAGRYFPLVEGQIHDLALVYYFNGEELILVWKVWAGEELIHIGAEDGRIYWIR